MLIMPGRITRRGDWPQTVSEWADATNGRSVAYDHLGQQLVLAGGDEGVYLAKIDLTALRAHRASAFGQALLPRMRAPALCDLPRGKDFQGNGALGRMSVPL